MSIRDFYNAPCATCGCDTSHFAGKCRDCGKINYTARAPLKRISFGRNLKIGRRAKHLNAERKKWEAETGNRYEYKPRG